MTTPQRNIVIIGGGIIGCSTAYYLTRHPSFSPANTTITILEATGIAAASSGKAGGLLATWARPACIVPLSYRLHKELAEEHNGATRWGYRAVHCGSITATAQDLDGGSAPQVGQGLKSGLPKKRNQEKGRTGGVPDGLDWIDEGAITSYSEEGNPSTTAQVHPFLFTTSMADLAREAGAKIVLGRATSIERTEGGVTGVKYEGNITGKEERLDATDVVLSAGPWTTHIWPELEMDAARVHSVVVEAKVSAYAVFTEIALPKGWAGSKSQKSVGPEMYARPDGTVYACGEGDTLHTLPKTAGLVLVDEDRAQDVYNYVSAVSTPMREGKVITKQACYLPSVVGHPGPLIGETRIKGLLVATGHTCWGIQNGPATGKVLSEIIFEGKAKSADLGSLDPREMMGEA